MTSMCTNYFSYGTLLSEYFRTYLELCTDDFVSRAFVYVALDLFLFLMHACLFRYPLE